MARVKQRRKIRPGCLISVLTAVAAVAVLLLSPPFNIQKIEVIGNSTVSTEVVMNAAGIAVNQNIFRADLGTAKKNIMSQQYVENVKISRVLPNKIRIKVSEGEVRAYVRYDENVVGIGSNRKVLCFVEPLSRRGGVPVIYGLSVVKSTVGEAIEVDETRKLDTAMQMVDSFDSIGILDKITSINISSTDNIVFRYTENLKVEFGTTDNYEYKMNWLSEIAEELGDNPSGDVNMINPENITYRQSVE